MLCLSDSELSSQALIDMADLLVPPKKSKGFLNRLKNVFRPGSSRDSSSPTAKLEEASNLRAKYSHFRILVIGRANAGKTTVLKRVCNTNEDPVYTKVRDQFCLIPGPHSYRPFTNRLTQPRRCHDLCLFV